MNTSKEAAAHNEVTRLTTQQQSWTEKRAQLVRTIAEVKANAGVSALAGTSTAKMADQLSRLHAELQIADQALGILEQQQGAAQNTARLARIRETQQQEIELYRQAAELDEQIKPHLDAIEALTGNRYYHQNSRSLNLYIQANACLHQAEYLEDRLSDDLRQALAAQRELAPTELDRAIYAIRYPNRVDEVTA